MDCVKKPWLDFEELLGCHWPSGDCGDRHRSLACPAAELAVACDGAAAVIADGVVAHCTVLRVVAVQMGRRAGELRTIVALCAHQRVATALEAGGDAGAEVGHDGSDSSHVGELSNRWGGAVSMRRRRACDGQCALSLHELQRGGELVTGGCVPGGETT